VIRPVCEIFDQKDSAIILVEFAQANNYTIVAAGFWMGKCTIKSAFEYPEIDFLGLDQLREEEIMQSTRVGNWKIELASVRDLCPSSRPKEINWGRW
jgi:hypothetical protein